MTKSMSGKRVAIHQPNYLPWLGYFHKIACVDHFVFLDDVQLPLGKSYCSRVRILRTGGLQWLTVPVIKGQNVMIMDARIADDRWKRKHVRTIELAYGKTPFFGKFWPAIRHKILNAGDSLAELNIALIQDISTKSGLKTTFSRSSGLCSECVEDHERILEIVKEVGGSVYLSGCGQGSKRYIREERFRDEGIALEWQDLRQPEYRKQVEGFQNHVSVIDMLFNCGDEWLKSI